MHELLKPKKKQLQALLSCKNFDTLEICVLREILLALFCLIGGEFDQVVLNMVQCILEEAVISIPAAMCY